MLLEFTRKSKQEKMMKNVRRLMIGMEGTIQKIMEVKEVEAVVVVKKNEWNQIRTEPSIFIIKYTHI